MITWRWDDTALWCIYLKPLGVTESSQVFQTFPLIQKIRRILLSHICWIQHVLTHYLQSQIQHNSNDDCSALISVDTADVHSLIRDETINSHWMNMCIWCDQTFPENPKKLLFVWWKKQNKGEDMKEKVYDHKMRKTRVPLCLTDIFWMEENSKENVN